MSIMCSYQNCLCVKYPCSSTAFFCLPTDSRRPTWIKNSGNKALQNIGLKAHRYFCENHFRECDIRSQFNRKILRKHAVPIAFSNSMTDGIKHSSKLSLEEQHDNSNSNNNLVIDKLNIDTNILDEYEDTNIQDETEENNTLKEDTDYSTIVDFYESYEEDCTKEIDDSDGLEGIFYEDSDSLRPDSSTVDFQYIAEDPKSEIEIPTYDPKPSEDPIPSTKNYQNQTASSSNDYEEDRHFALSLVGYFQRLPKDKKAIAKLKILHYLTDLDIGLTSDL